MNDPHTAQKPLAGPAAQVAFWLPALLSLSLNGIGLTWAFSWLLIGALGVGLSSSPVEDLQFTWYSFLCLAGTLPVLVNGFLLVWVLFRRSRRVLAGWLAGLGCAMLLGAAIVLLLAGAIVLKNAFTIGF